MRSSRPVGCGIQPVGSAAAHAHRFPHMSAHVNAAEQRGMPSSMCTSTAMRHALSAREGTKATSSLSGSDLSFDLCRPSIPGASSHERDAFASSTHDQQGSLHDTGCLIPRFDHRAHALCMPCAGGDKSTREGLDPQRICLLRGRGHAVRADALLLP